MLIFGVNPVLEALRAGRVTSVTIGARGLRELGEHAKGRVDEVAPSLAPRLGEVARDAAARGIDVKFVDLTEIDRMTRGAVHQGVAAEAGRPRTDWTPADLVASARSAALIVVLDGIEDPQNFGAILRTAEAAGADGVIRQERHSAPMSGTVAKASAGASEHVRIATVVNIARAIEELKGAGLLSARMPANFSVPLPPSDPDALTEEEDPLTDIDLEELGLLTPRPQDD